MQPLLSWKSSLSVMGKAETALQKTGGHHPRIRAVMLSQIRQLTKESKNICALLIMG